MGVRQLAEYLQINEKKVYALASEGRLPGTKITGKWLFPRQLIDQWLIESSHGGVLTDRLILAGSDDPLLTRVVSHLTQDIQARALVSYTATGTGLGLALLARRRADACGLHWGPAEQSDQRHPALLRQHPEHTQWVLVRLFHRVQGLLLAPGVRADDAAELFARPLRWVLRQEGAGSQRYLEEILGEHGADLMGLNAVGRAFTEHEAASLLATGQADAAPGIQSAAGEFGIGFLPLGREAFDLALPRQVFFRTLFQRLLDVLRTDKARATAEQLGGYDFQELGRMVWAP
jgi:excisionase family DNA binding protein